MDSLTQLQNYVASIGSFMTDSLHAAWNEAGALTAEQVRQADRERRAALANPELPPIPASSPAAAADGSAGGGADGDVLVVNGVLIPSLNAPLYSGLPPSVEFHMADRAHQLFKRVLEADALMQALPPVHHPEHDLQAQVERIKFLEAHGEKAAHQLKEAQDEAGVDSNNKPFRKNMRLLCPLALRSFFADCRALCFRAVVSLCVQLCGRSV